MLTLLCNELSFLLLYQHVSVKVKLLRCSQLRIVIHVHVEENNIAVQTFFYNNAIQISLYNQTSAL